MLDIPGPEAGQGPRFRPGDDRPDGKERVKGFLKRLKGSQSQVQVSTTEGPSRRYGPVLPLTEDLLKRLTGQERKLDTDLLLRLHPGLDTDIFSPVSHAEGENL